MVSRLGTVISVTGKIIIVRGDKISPRSMGKTVIDTKMKEIGKVVDVFGPVSSPFAKIVAYSPTKIPCDSVLYIR